jgi:endonuclease VIII
MTTEGETVRVTGHSVCAEPALAGPAGWTATVRAGKISRWQVTAA